MQTGEILVGNFLNHEAAAGRFLAKTAHGHAAMRKPKLDCVFESQRFIRMNVIVCMNSTVISHSDSLMIAPTRRMVISENSVVRNMSPLSLGHFAFGLSSYPMLSSPIERGVSGV
jgi:hypothetical protein